MRPKDLKEEFVDFQNEDQRNRILNNVVNISGPAKPNGPWHTQQRCQCTPEQCYQEDQRTPCPAHGFEAALHSASNISHIQKVGVASRSIQDGHHQLNDKPNLLENVSQPNGYAYGAQDWASGCLENEGLEIGIDLLQESVNPPLPVKRLSIAHAAYQAWFGRGIIALCRMTN